MKSIKHSLPNRAGRFPGYTLLELVFSMAIAGLLLTGMASSIHLAGRGFQAEQHDSGKHVRAAEVQRQVTTDMRFALKFTELTTNAATFRVPDRDGDGKTETIRYAWSGTAGDPLTFSVNGSDPEIILADVHQFDLSSLTTTIPAVELPPESDYFAGHMLFVSGGTVVHPDALAQIYGEDPYIIPTVNERKQITLFQSWGYTVSVIRPDETTANFNEALQLVDLVYISGESATATTNSVLFDTDLGIVCEQHQLAPEIGFADSSETVDGDRVTILLSHEITAGFSLLQEVVVTTTDQPLATVGGVISLSLKTLAQRNDLLLVGQPSLVVLQSGDLTHTAGIVPGRRVMLPWGTGSFDIDTLNTNGRTLLKQSLEWADN